MNTHPERTAPKRVKGMKCVEPDCNNGILLLRFSQKSERFFYGCSNYPKCNGAIPANKDGSPRGKPRTRELQGYRRKAHEVFDRIWKDDHISRSGAYMWFQTVMHKEPEDAHIFKLDIKGCKELIELVYSHGPGTLFWEEWFKSQYRFAESKEIRKKIKRRIKKSRKIMKKRAKNKVKHSKKRRSPNNSWYVNEQE